MSSLFSKALVYLGLVDEDQPQAVEADREPIMAQPPQEGPRSIRPIGGGTEGRRVEPPPASSRTAAPSGVGGMSADRGSIRPIRTQAQTSILVVEEFGDAKILADWVRDQVPVVLDLRRTDGDLTRRVIDFSSGLIYALDGRMRKVGDALILITPVGLELSLEEKQRLQALGAYEIELSE